MEQTAAKADLPALSPPSLRGFCFFNSVAITTKLLQQKLNVGKVLIVDWVSSELLGPGSTFRKPPPNPASSSSGAHAGAGPDGLLYVLLEH